MPFLCVFIRALEFLHSVAFGFHTWYFLKLIVLGFQVVLHWLFPPSDCGRVAVFRAYHGVIISADRTLSIFVSVIALQDLPPINCPYTFVVVQGLHLIGCPYLFYRVYLLPIALIYCTGFTPGLFPPDFQTRMLSISSD